MNIINGINSLKSMILREFRKLDLIVYLSVLLFLFFTFQHGDLFHTSISSYGYLNGHFLDFYSYNKEIATRNDYFPLIYIIFAIWNIPLKILGLVEYNNSFELGSRIEKITKVEIFWTKSLLVLSFFIVGVIIYNIAFEITKNKKTSLYSSIVFLTSPISIFAIFIFGQYDIIQMVFSTLSIYFYFKKDILKFVMLMSLAISLKFFPVIIFFPLLLLYEKRVIKLIKYIILSLSVTIVQIVVYFGDSVFINNIFNLGSDKLSEIKTINLSLFFNPSYLILFFLILCIYCYIKECESDKEWIRLSLEICVISYALFFTTIVWHPQWIIMIIPFFSLLFIYIKDSRKFFVMDFIGMIAFSLFNFYIHRDNVDNALLENGVLNFVISNSGLFVRDMLPKKNIAELMSVIFLIYLYIPLFFIKIQNINTEKCIIKKIEEDKKFLLNRTILGLSIFVIPCLLCAFLPKNIAQKINIESYTLKGSENLIDNSAIPLFKNNKIIQSIRSDKFGLSQIYVRFGTYKRINHSKIFYKLFYKNTLVRSGEINTEKMQDNLFYPIVFEPIVDSNDKIYNLELTSNSDNNNFVAVWVSDYDSYKQGEFSFNSVIQNKDINFILRYDMDLVKKKGL